MNLPHYEIEFTKQGAVFDQSQVTQILNDLEQYSDLLILCHGWNNDIADARKLYEALTQSVERVIDEGVVSGLDQRRFSIVRLFWPSKKFTDEDLIPGGGAASATQENDDSLLRLLENLKKDPLRLGDDEIDPIREATMDKAKALVPSLDSDPQARQEYVLLLRSILDPAAADPDDGSEEFFSHDPQDLFKQLGEPVVAPGAAGSGGATSVGGGGAAGIIGDALSGIRAAARRLANFATYYQMKNRAGIVGFNGLASVLQRIRDRKSDIKLHLVGHSFGGRLVTAAASVLPPNTPAVSLTLLQAAYSHNGLAEDFDGSRDGAFRSLLAEKRVSGPVIITHTKNDRAVGIAYPLASRIARDQAAALGDQNDPYGGMGRNGAQHTPETDGLHGKLLQVGDDYSFAPGRVFNLRADEFIKGHSDIAGFQVAYALLKVVQAVQ